MPLTRKQAWRRVRVRQEMGETKDECSPRGGKRSMSDKMPPAERQWGQQQQQEGGQENERPSPNDGSAIKSPERKVLDKWRLPKEGREPSARPGVSASKRQAAAACVRVGSRVSFNTVVAAILIPSAKDLHAAARRELWWQETDYRDFRMNFIQFMRNPPVENDDFEMSPADIAAEATCEVAAEEEEKQMTVEDLPQPVMVSAIVYEDNSSTPCDAAPAGATRSGVCAWTVEGSEETEAPTAATVSVSSSSSTSCADEIVESDIEERVLAAAAAAVAVAASNNVVSAAPAAAATVTASAVEIDFSPPPAPVTPIADAASEAAAAVAVFCATATEQVPRPSSALPAVVCDVSDNVGDEGDDNAVAVDGGGCWDEQETNCRVPPCLSWGPSADDAERAAREEEGVEEEEEDGDDNTVRVRRSFSNLETARRLGGGQVSAATGEDPTDSDDGGESASQSRPRALSLDGWFTCGLENDVETKSYETHDHAGRLRELVTLPPFPAMGAVTPPPRALPSPKLDLTEAMRQLRVTFNVSVNEDGVNGKQGAGRECNADGGDGETKCHAEEKDGVMSFSSAAAPRNFSELGAVDSSSIGSLGVGGALNGLQPDFDVCVA